MFGTAGRGTGRDEHEVDGPDTHSPGVLDRFGRGFHAGAGP
jgi:hypothetical protein